MSQPSPTGSAAGSPPASEQTVDQMLEDIRGILERNGWFRDETQLAALSWLDRKKEFSAPYFDIKRRWLNRFDGSRHLHASDETFKKQLGRFEAAITKAGGEEARLDRLEDEVDAMLKAKDDILDVKLGSLIDNIDRVAQEESWA